MGVSIGVGPVRVSKRRGHRTRVGVGVGAGPVRVGAGVGGGRKRRRPGRRYSTASTATPRPPRVDQTRDELWASHTVDWIVALIFATPIGISLYGLPISAAILLAVYLTHRSTFKARAAKQRAERPRIDYTAEAAQAEQAGLVESAAMWRAAAEQQATFPDAENDLAALSKVTVYDRMDRGVARLNASTERRKQRTAHYRAVAEARKAARAARH